MTTTSSDSRGAVEEGVVGEMMGTRGGAVVAREEGWGFRRRSEGK
jgi:hypothetical protein